MNLNDIFTSKAISLMNNSLFTEIKGEVVRDFCDLEIKFQNGRIVAIIKKDKFK